jgi:hypothetical protein
LLLAGLYLDGVRDATVMSEQMWNVLATRNQKMVKDGKMLESRDENLAHLQDMAREFLSDELPRLQVLGLL